MSHTLSTQSISSGNGGSGGGSSITGDTNLENSFLINYEDRGFIRQVIRESLAEEPRQALSLREHIERLSLESIIKTPYGRDLDGGILSSSTEEIIDKVVNSSASPTTISEAIQATLRLAVPSASSDTGVYYEKTTSSTYLEYYNAIIAAYDLIIAI